MEGKGVKQVVFLVLVAVVVGVVFILIQNADIVVQNLPLIVLAIVVMFLIARFDYLIMLKDYERAVIFTFGKVSRVGGPGWTVIFPPFESMVRVDLRTRAIDIPKQDIITKDNIEVVIDAVIFIRVNKDNASVINSVVQVDNYVEASKLYVIGLIRDKAGSLELNELISQIEGLNVSLREGLEKLAKQWGVVVAEASIKDINIPRTVLESMHEQKAAVQRKLARMEGAKAQQAEIEAVKAAAEQLSDRALAYYYVKALEKLGEGKSTKFIFPMELTSLAKSLSSRRLSEDDIEGLMEKYAPVVKEIVKGAQKKKKKE
ncbi:MAG: SPFH domain-containing protein [archaeon]|nr:SPFH domain-containing protein [archaeon]